LLFLHFLLYSPGLLSLILLLLQLLWRVFLKESQQGLKQCLCGFQSIVEDGLIRVGNNNLFLLLHLLLPLSFDLLGGLGMSYVDIVLFLHIIIQKQFLAELQQLLCYLCPHQLISQKDRSSQSPQLQLFLILEYLVYFLIDRFLQLAASQIHKIAQSGLLARGTQVLCTQRLFHAFL